MKTILAVAALALLAGCATLATDDCGMDSYQLGRRDALLFRIRPQDETYKARCGESTFDVGRYLQGWREGYSDRPSPW